MRVRMKTLARGPDFSAAPGQVVDVSEDRGRDLIAQGYAEAVDAPPPTIEASVPPQPETAVLKRAPARKPRG